MRVAVIASLIALAGLVLFTLGTIETLRIGARVAKVVAVKGEGVAIIPPRLGRKETSVRKLKVGTLILTGTTVRTGPDGEVVLRWVDDLEMHIGPDTELKVTRTSYDRFKKALEALFRLELGEVFVRIKRRLSAHSRVELETPAITAAVQGTAFGVRVRPGGRTNVWVEHGEVLVRTKGGQGISLSAGQSLTATPDGSVSVSKGNAPHPSPSISQGGDTHPESVTPLLIAREHIVAGATGGK